MLIPEDICERDVLNIIIGDSFRKKKESEGRKDETTVSLRLMCDGSLTNGLWSGGVVSYAALHSHWGGPAAYWHTIVIGTIVVLTLYGNVPYSCSHSLWYVGALWCRVCAEVGANRLGLGAVLLSSLVFLLIGCGRGGVGWLLCGVVVVGSVLCRLTVRW